MAHLAFELTFAPGAQPNFSSLGVTTMPAISLNNGPYSRWGALAVSALLACALSACGGGGGDGGGSTGESASSAINQEAYLKASNAEAADSLGYSVAISGDTLVVAAIGEASNQTTITNGATGSADNSAAGAGAVYVYTRSDNSWVQQAYLKAPNAEASDNFGRVVAIDGDTIVVGTQFESSNQTTITNGPTASANNAADRAGAAYVFVRSGSTWSQQAYLKAPNAEEQDRFGASVAISGNTVVVGAFQEDSNQTTITNGSSASGNNSDFLSGAAYVFVRNVSAWSQQAYLKASNTGGNFGYSVAVSGDTVVVGAKGAAATNTGAAYVFTRSGTSWSQQAELKAPNAGQGDYFGESLAISGDTVVVGASREDSSQTTITNGNTASADNSAFGAGAAYVFVRSGSNWSQQAYLKAPNAEADDQFGVSVAISGDTIVVGSQGESSNQTTITSGSSASADNSATNAGAAYVFIRNATDWSQKAYLKAPNAEAGDQFGGSVAISGDSIVVGASSEDANQTTITSGSAASSDNSASGAGAAYVFKVRS
jgi:hypothetical protein